jgi:hypothetical protein
MFTFEEMKVLSCSKIDNFHDIKWFFIDIFFYIESIGITCNVYMFPSSKETIFTDICIFISEVKNNLFIGKTVNNIDK